MKITVVGTGAMGSVYAALLGKAGHEVWAIDIWPEHIEAIATSGLNVSGASGTYVVDNLHVGHAPSDAGPCDVWIIATKASAVDEVAAADRPAARTRHHRHGVPERPRRRRPRRPSDPAGPHPDRHRRGIRFVDP